MELGSGTYSSVVKKEANGVMYAQKLFKRSQDGISSDFVREMTALRLLSHPNVITLFATTFTPERSLLLPLAVCDLAVLCYTMEYDARSMAFGVACALEYLQSVGVFHCDVKLRNVLVYQKGSELYPALADFGHCEIEFSRMIRPNTTNTASYRSPEMYISCSDIDSAHLQRVDYSSTVWSYGVLFYNLYSKRAPYSFDKKGLVTVNLQTMANAVGLNSSQAKNLHKLYGIELNTSIRNSILEDTMADDLFERCMSFTAMERISFQRIIDHPLFAGSLRVPHYTSLYSEPIQLTNYKCVGVAVAKYCEEEYYENLRLLSATCSAYCALRDSFPKRDEQTFVYACFSLCCKMFSIPVKSKAKLNTNEVNAMEKEILENCNLRCILPTASSILEGKKLRESKQLFVAKKVIRLLLVGTVGTITELVEIACS